MGLRAWVAELERKGAEAYAREYVDDPVKRKMREERLNPAIVVKKYKTTWTMQDDLNKMEKRGYVAMDTTAAAGWFTGTRSYTVTYRKKD